MLLKEKEIYNQIVAERKNEIRTLNNEIIYDKLTYYFKSEKRKPLSVNDFNRSLGFMRKIRDGSIGLEKAKKSRQIRLNLNKK